MDVKKIISISLKTGQVLSEEGVEVLPMTEKEYRKPMVDMIFNSEGFRKEILGFDN